MADMPTLQKIIILDLQYQSSDPRVISLTQLMELGKQNRTSKYPIYEAVSYTHLVISDTLISFCQYLLGLAQCPLAGLGHIGGKQHPAEIGMQFGGLKEFFF